MKHYDGSGFGTHTVEVSLQYEGFKGTIIAEMGGNCSGGSLISTILSSLENDFEPNMEFEQNKKHIEVDSDDYVRNYLLFKGKNELLIDGNEIENSIVGLKIIDWKPERR